MRTEFESQGKLELVVGGILSEHCAAHYGLEKKKKSIRLVKKSWVVPARYEFGGDERMLH